MLPLLSFLPLVVAVTPHHHDYKRDTSSITVSRTSSISTYKLLNQTLGGRLKAANPLAQPCFSSFSDNANDAAYNASGCAIAESVWDSATSLNYFGAYAQPNWGSCQAKAIGCELDWTNPSNPDAFKSGKKCYQGSVPSYYIDVTCARDVLAAYAFSAVTKVPLAIKNSGHDYKGRASAPGSLGLWVHNLNNMTHNAAYTPAGCSASYDAITIGAGASLGAVFAYVNGLGKTIVGGLSSSVALSGGYVQGGGHSPLSNTLGLAVDNVVEFKVVTPDGYYRTASRCQNKDLFFALAGGGGGTFGVVLESTHIVHPKITPTFYQAQFLSPNATTADTFIDLLVNNSLSWVKTNAYGGLAAVNPLVNGTNTVILVSTNQTVAEMTAAVQPITDFINTLGSYKVVARVLQATSYYDAYENYITAGGEVEPIGLDMAISSRFLGDDLFQSSKTPTTAAALKKAMNINLPSDPALIYGAPLQILMVSPYHTPATGYTSETPAWRSTIWHTAFASSWGYNATLSTINAAYAQVDQAAAVLRTIAPNTGSYQNEAAVHEPNYQASFWGTTNYNKLVTIKKKYDPLSLLQVWQGIGYNAAATQYACYV